MIVKEFEGNTNEDQIITQQQKWRPDQLTRCKVINSAEN